MVTVQFRHHPHVSEHQGQLTSSAYLTQPGNCLRPQTQSLIEVTLRPGNARQCVLCGSNTPGKVRIPSNRQTLFEEGSCRVVVATEPGDGPGAEERL